MVALWSWEQDFTHFLGELFDGLSGIRTFGTILPLSLGPNDPVSKKVETLGDMGDFGLFLG